MNKEKFIIRPNKPLLIMLACEQDLNEIFYDRKCFWPEHFTSFKGMEILLFKN